MQKIINSLWFCPMGGECIGIIVIENNTGERKAYIGAGDGRDEGIDAQKIANGGAKITASTLERLLTQLKGDQYAEDNKNT